MTSQRQIRIVHKNDLSAYLGDWKNMLSIVRPDKAQYYRHKGIPATFEALHNNTYDLCVVLEHLDSRLQVLEEKPISQPDFQTYAEARVFLKAFYVFFCILLDNVAGIIEFFYKENQPIRGLKKGFKHLLDRGNQKDFPGDLRRLLEKPSSWFPEVVDTRDDLVHNYDSLLISIEQGEGGKTILGQFNIKGCAHREYVSIREHFGFLLCEYQKLIDNLLDHFDTEFRHWYGIVQGKLGRTVSIMSGCVALPLWWAYKYGNYRREDLQVSES